MEKVCKHSGRGFVRKCDPGVYGSCVYRAQRNYYGGATGIGLAISHYLPVSLSTIIFALNAVLFVLGALVLGKKFAVATIASTFIYPTFLSVMQKIPGIDSLTDNVLLSTLYAGLLVGLGIGLIVRVGSSTGGTDIVALVFNKWFHSPVAALLYVVDFLILGSQIFFSDTEQIMYGILALMMYTVILNKVMLMGQSQIQLFIISDSYDEIRRECWRSWMQV